MRYVYRHDSLGILQYFHVEQIARGIYEMLSKKVTHCVAVASSSRF